MPLRRRRLCCQPTYPQNEEASSLPLAPPTAHPTRRRLESSITHRPSPRSSNPHTLSTSHPRERQQPNPPSLYDLDSAPAPYNITTTVPNGSDHLRLSHVSSAHAAPLPEPVIHEGVSCRCARARNARSEILGTRFDLGPRWLRELLIALGYHSDPTVLRRNAV